MFFGACLALFICDADKVIRPDGSRVILMKNPSWKTEFIGLWQTISTEPWILLLFPMFFASNWFYTYQQNGINAAHFDTRTKALNGFLYWFAQIVAAALIGPLLDVEGVRRRIRARVGLGVLFLFTMAIWGGGYAWQKGYTRESVAAADFTPTDWSTPGYVGPMFLYFFYGMYDAVWQGFVYWYVTYPPLLYYMQANFVKQADGCPRQLRSQARKSGRLLQGPSVRWVRRHVESRQE